LIFFPERVEIVLLFICEAAPSILLFFISVFLSSGGFSSSSFLLSLVV
jgi:hypothetical protein